MARPAPLIEDVCDTFGLGRPIAPWQVVRGGLSNELRRLETEVGRFAVKRMVVGTEDAGFRDNVEASYRIEREAIRAGVPAPPPVSLDGGARCLAEIECEDGSPCWVRVHEWAVGARTDHREVSAGTARQIGSMVATVHSLGLPGEQAEAGATRHGEEVWRQLDWRATQAGAGWAAALSGLVPVVVRLESRIGQRPPQRVVPGHRDVDDKNTLSTPTGRLTLIDWDAAGAIEAAHEVTGLYFDWSGARFGEPRHEIVRAVREGYDARSKYEVRPDPSGWIAAQLGWLLLNVRRALGDFGAESVSEGETELGSFVEHLPRIETSLDRWLDDWASA